VTWLIHAGASYWVATIRRLLKIIGLFCKRALQKRRYSAKETYNFKEPTNRSHLIWWMEESHVLIYVTCLTDMCDVTYWNVGRDSLICDMTYPFMCLLWWMEESHLLTYVTWLIDIFDMTHWYVRHDSLKFVEMTHWYVRRDSPTYVTWLVHSCTYSDGWRKFSHGYMWHDSLICLTWLIDMCDMTLLICATYDWLTCVTWLSIQVPAIMDGGNSLNDIFDMTHWYVQHLTDWHLWHDSSIHVPTMMDGGNLLIDICDMTHWYVWHDSLIFVTWLIDKCDMTYWHVCLIWLIHAGAYYDGWRKVKADQQLLIVGGIVHTTHTTHDPATHCKYIHHTLHIFPPHTTYTPNPHYTDTHHILHIHSPHTTDTPNPHYTDTHHTLHIHSPHTTYTPNPHYTDTHHTLHRHPPHTTHTPTTTSKERESRVTHFNESRRYGVTTVSSLLKIIGLFCRISSLL